MSEAKVIKLLEGEPAPYFGLLVDEPRFRQFKAYEAYYKESPRVTEELLELRIKNKDLSEDCECTPIKDAFMWTMIGVVIGILVPHP